jgi:hypothetical protein
MIEKFGGGTESELSNYAMSICSFSRLLLLEKMRKKKVKGDQAVTHPAHHMIRCDRLDC